MKRYLVIIIMLMSAVAAAGQTVYGGAARLDRTVHDFGDIVSGQGPVSCTFTVTNVGSEDLNIFNVISSCGCTDVRWTRESIAPGGTGTIAATYSNEDGPMPFDKTLTVYLSCTKQPLILRLRGNVTAKAEPLEVLYPVHYGPLGMRSSDIKGPNVEQGQPRSGEVMVANISDRDISVSFADVSDGLSLSIPGGVIKARQTATLSYTITPSRSRWGRQWYYATPLIDGHSHVSSGEPSPATVIRGAEAVVAEANNALSPGCSIIGISSWTKENFTDMTREQKAQGAVLSFDRSSVSLGKVKAGTRGHFRFSYTNSGKSPAVIYAADKDSGRLSLTFDKTVQTGATGVLEGTVDTSGLAPGEFLMIITLTTNSPSRPLANLYVTGLIK